MSRGLTPLTAILVVTACASAPHLPTVTNGQLLRPTYLSRTTGLDRQFLLYLPAGYASAGKLWPVIYFLHGDGERGNGLTELDYVLKHGPLMEAWIQKRDLPFIIIAPQLPLFGRASPASSGADPPDALAEAIPAREAHGRSRSARLREAYPIERQRSEDFPGDHAPYPESGDPPDGWMAVEADVLRILDTVLADYNADPDRVYLTGLSYGGFGTFDLAAEHPDRWAAISPIVGTGRREDVERLAAEGIPTWLIGAGADMVVKPHWLYQMARWLEEAGHPSLRFTVHEDMSHDAWIRPYAGEDFYDWLLRHRRSDRR
jgi:predicted peptidase